VLKQYTPNLNSKDLNNRDLNEQGFSLMETLISIAIGGLLLSGLLTSIFGYRSLYDKDLSRTNAKSSVRSGLDFIGIHLRQAGERLNSGFPAILLNDGAGIVPDELIIRRNLLDETPKVCLNARSFHRSARISRHTVPACPYTDTEDIYEFANGTIRNIHQDVGETWSRLYRTNATFLYMLEEWRFNVDTTNNILQVNINDEATNNIIAGVENLEIEIVMKDGNVKTSFGVNDNWKEIKLINVSITASSTVGHESKTETFTASFYPRNILSEDL